MLDLKIVLFVTILFNINLIEKNNLCDAADKTSSVINLNEDNWRAILKDEWMVEFYAPWCPACKNLASTWDEFSVWADEVDVSTAKIDVVTSPALSGRFFVTALPTIFHVINGEFRQYRGPRDLQSLKDLVEQNKWEKLEKVSEWTRPDSIQMSIVSYFFKISHMLKELNNQLLKEYGLPAWVSYALFAIATILLGAILGLLLVCIIDFLFPPKMSQRQSFSETKEKELILPQVDDEDIAGDELEDEDEEEQSTSDGEKYSGSDSDEVPESDKKKSPPSSPSKKSSNNASPKASPDVRKRRSTRKAD